jgi:hypothetical protein
MLRVVDKQGYHLRWIEVPTDPSTGSGQGKKTGPQGEGPAEGIMTSVR